MHLALLYVSRNQQMQNPDVDLTYIQTNNLHQSRKKLPENLVGNRMLLMVPWFAMSSRSSAVVASKATFLISNFVRTSSFDSVSLFRFFVLCCFAMLKSNLCPLSIFPFNFFKAFFACFGFSNSTKPKPRLKTSDPRLYVGIRWLRSFPIFWKNSANSSSLVEKLTQRKWKIHQKHFTRICKYIQKISKSKLKIETKNYEFYTPTN